MLLFAIIIEANYWKYFYFHEKWVKITVYYCNYTFVQQKLVKASEQDSSAYSTLKYGFTKKHFYKIFMKFL